MSEGRVVSETPQDGVTLLTLDRPEKLNALNGGMLDQLFAALEKIRQTQSRAIVITGTGRAFSAGGDLHEMKAMDPFALPGHLAKFQDLARALRDLPAPIIAAVNGYAMAGGFELACCCDIRIASDTARFAVADVDVNLSPTSGLTWQLPRLVGPGWAHYLTLLSPTIDATLALKIGLVQEVVRSDQLTTRAIALAGGIANKPPLGARLSRLGLNRGLNASQESALDWELEAELECFADPLTAERFGAITSGRLRKERVKADDE